MDNKETPRMTALKKYNVARGNLLLMVGLTAINVILAAVGSEYMMLFSATVPYFTAILGTITEFGLPLVGCVISALVMIAVYFICWIFSKKHYGWMITALVLFSLDTLVLVLLYLLAMEVSGIVDAAIHIWVLYYLIIGVSNGAKLKVLPEDEITNAEEIEVDSIVPETNLESENSNTPTLRVADTGVKSRVLLEANALGRHICYRRVKRINELVIDGYVYDDVEMLVESAHALNAIIDGHRFQVGYDGSAHSYLRVDGETVARKLRLF